MREFIDYQLPEKIESIKLGNIPDFDIEDYDLSNPKELINYFKSIERICRNSHSYKKFIKFLREEVDMVKCSFYENVNNIDTFSIKIHIHHTPLTLYDIVTTVYSKRLSNHESLTELMVAKEVMWCHYNMMVGLIPLSETIHELVHNGQLFIPLNKVFGLYSNFIQLYNLYLDPQLRSNLARAEEESKAYDFIESTKILEVSPVYIDPTGSYSFPNKEEIVEVLSNKINHIDKEAIQNQYTIKDKEEFIEKRGN